jgi:cytochrome c biogenesis protein CcmG, thiol:disulfide interchange protein DsbE
LPLANAGESRHRQGVHIRPCWIAGLLSAGLSVFANERLPVLEVGDNVYTNVTVTKVTATDVFFNHNGGFGNAKLKNLDPQWQKHFRFDPEKAGLVETQQLAAVVEYRKSLAARPVTRPPAVAGRETTAPPGGIEEMVDPRPRLRSFLNQHVPQVVVEKWLTPPPDTAGKFVLIDFWATWCGPCRAAIPAMNQIHARYKDRLVVIGLSDEPEANVRRMTSPRTDYPVAIDTQRRLSGTIGVQTIPFTLIIDPRGIVRYEGHPGYLTPRGLETLFARYAN